MKIGPHIRQAILLSALDCFYIFIAFAIALSITFPPGVSLQAGIISHGGYFVVFLVVWCWTAMDQGLWTAARTEEFASYLYIILRTLIEAMVFSTFVMIILVDWHLDAAFLSVFFMASLMCILACRSLLQTAIMFVRLRGYFLTRTLIIGANENTVRLVRAIQQRKSLGYRLIGFLTGDEWRIPLLANLGVAHLGDFSALERILAGGGIDAIIISLPVDSHYEILRNLTKKCEQYDVPVHLMADFCPLRIARSRLRYMDDIPLLSWSATPEDQTKILLKRLIDLCLSAVLLVAFAPVFLVVAIAIKLDSKGPVFFLQERVGHNQRRFKMFKFRSMRIDAEKIRAALEELNEADGPVFKIRNDPRVTRVGRFIRKYSIDELPQLINVFWGQMSLVGPRPPIPAEVVHYTWHQRRRLSVKPGMTGLWQVSGRSNVTFMQWVEMDLAYIDNWSLWLDFVILFKTFGAVIHGRGAA